MNISECYVGQRVYHEPDNNAAFWRGEITSIQDNGTVFVKWDGSADQIREHPAILEAEYALPERTAADELRNQLQNILAVAGMLPFAALVSEREEAKDAIETAVSTIMEKVAPVLEE